MALNGGTIVLARFNNRAPSISPAVVSFNGSLLQANSTQTAHCHKGIDTDPSKTRSPWMLARHM